MIRTANLTHSVSRNAGGLYESVRRLVQSLQDTGMEVCVFGVSDAHTPADVAAWNPVPVKAFRPCWPAQFGYSQEFRAALEEFAPDLTHTHGIWNYPSVATNNYSRRRGVPYIISAHGMLDPWAIRNSRWKKAVAHFLYEGAHLREAACLRALCESEARSIRHVGLKNPIAVIPNGIDLPTESTKNLAQSAKPPWSDLYPPAAGKKALLFLSRIHPKKGLVNLLKAWARVARPPSSDFCPPAADWVLAIAGWDQGGHEAELKRLCVELEIPIADVREMKSEIGNRKSEMAPPSVLFLGPQFNDAKSVCYAHCDGFVLPSFSEGVPMVVLEAWAYGKPVLMTPECNLPVGFSRNAAIRMAPSEDDIVRGLQELFRLPSSHLGSLGAAGLTLVREQFAWPVIGKQMGGLYEWMLGGGARPDCILDD